MVNSHRSTIVVFFVLFVIFISLSFKSLNVAYEPSSQHVTQKQSVLDNVINKNEEYDFTVISQSSFERVYFLPYWIERWHGPLSIAFFLYGDGINIYENAIRSFDIPARLNIITYFTKQAEPYPINMLRNIAMDHVKTSHFWLADMDMWPALDLYETLISLPKSYLSRDDVATIVPAFEYPLPKNTECTTFTNCIENIKNKLPSTKPDILKCIDDGSCFRFRVKSRTHSYHFDDWYTLPSSTYVTPVECMENDIQEPYIFVKRSAKLPHFDERFVNYGKNKVQWIIHLRLAGFKYYVLSQSFAIDVPHPKSKFSNDWFAEGSVTHWRTRMHVLVDAFAEEVERETLGTSIQTSLCRK